MLANRTEEHHVRTAVFDGPLDLLLYLIRRDGIDVREIPIAHVTAEYLAVLERMRELDLNVAGEFLVMAATLLLWKSRSVLPKEEGEEAEGQLDLEAEFSPDDLIRQLGQGIVMDVLGLPQPVSADEFTCVAILDHRRSLRADRSRDHRNHGFWCP